MTCTIEASPGQPVEGDAKRRPTPDAQDASCSRPAVQLEKTGPAFPSGGPVLQDAVGQWRVTGCTRLGDAMLLWLAPCEEGDTGAGREDLVLSRPDTTGRHDTEKLADLAEEPTYRTDPNQLSLELF